MEKLTKKELWKVFLHQLTIRGANNYERQQNAGFTEAMMPVIEKYYEDPEAKGSLCKAYGIFPDK